jgi:TM2 domain-containing membrane protein YozV
MKDKNIAALLAFFLGSVGAHKFYLGQIGWGIVYLLFSWTLIPYFAAIIEFIMLALMDQDEFNRRFNGAYTLGSSHPVVVNMLPPAGYGPPGYPHHAGPHAGYPPAPHGYPHAGGPPGTLVPPGYQSPYGPQGSYPAPQHAGAGAKPDLATQLDKLNELRIAGLLTEEEFKQQKEKLLRSM